MISGPCRTPCSRSVSTPASALLSTFTRCPPISPSIRKTFKTGRLIPPRGQHPEAGEIRLILELECPGERALEVDRALLGEVERAGVGGRGIAGVEQAVAIGVLGKDRRWAGHATIGVGFANDDRTTLQLGKTGDDLESAIDVLKLGGDSHLDVTVGDSRRAFGVEREEIERGADLARGVVGPAQAVLDEVTEEPGRLRSSRPGDLRPAHARGRQRPLDGVHGVVMEPMVVLGCAPPVHDVQLVPDFPVPLLDLGAARAAGTVGHPLVDPARPTCGNRWEDRPSRWRYCRPVATSDAGRAQASATVPAA